MATTMGRTDLDLVALDRLAYLRHDTDSIDRKGTDMDVLNYVGREPGSREAVLLDLAEQLECKLADMDALGQHLAAADLDSAIGRLRQQADQIRLA